MLFIYVFFQFFFMIVFFVVDFLVSVGNSFIYIFSGVDVFFLFTFFSGVDISFCQWKNRKISTFHKLCTIYIHQNTWTKQKIKSVFHFSLSLSLVQWICICCSTWKVSDFLFINCCLYPLFFVQNAEKKWAWVFDIWSKKKKKSTRNIGRNSIRFGLNCKLKFST